MIGKVCPTKGEAKEAKAIECIIEKLKKTRSVSCISLPEKNLRQKNGRLIGCSRLTVHFCREEVFSSPTGGFCYDEHESSSHILGVCGAVVHQNVARKLPLTPSSILKFVRAIALEEALYRYPIMFEGNTVYRIVLWPLHDNIRFSTCVSN